jgi:hypothetical protein
VEVTCGFDVNRGNNCPTTFTMNFPIPNLIESRSLVLEMNLEDCHGFALCVPYMDIVQR